MPFARIRRLSVSNFRSYHAAQIEVGAGPVVLVGPNGSGKTNLIEAISFLAPGRGLRRALLEDVAFSEGDGSWAVAADVEGALGLATLGTGIEPPTSEDTAVTRKCRIDREPVASATAFVDHLRVVWLVPAMDGLFNGPASERRRFLDRLALALDAEHMTRVNALERALRSRNRLLEDARPDPHWLDAIEHETAELAVAVTALRVETVGRLQAALAARKHPASAFPAAALALDGWMERLVPLEPAVAVEDRYRALLKANRARDAAAGRTLEGPHLTDLLVTHADKQIAAAEASTGEQKALLIGLILAHTGLLAEMSGFAPVLLLDEVIAHLDPARRADPQDRFPRVIPHSDGAGEIDRVGEGVSPSRVGERVWVWNGQWRRPFGTAAEWIVLPSEQAVPLPAHISMEAGACLGIPAYTAYQAVVLTGAEDGSTVLVAGGAGAVGHYAIQLAKKRKATVIATVSSPAKAEIARRAGADHVIDYRRENVGEQVMALTGKRGVNAAIEVDLAANARLLPAVLAPNSVVAIYGSSAPETSIPFQFLLQNSVELKFFLVYQMPPQLRARARAEITGMLERGELIHNVAQTFVVSVA